VFWTCSFLNMTLCTSVPCPGSPSFRFSKAAWSHSDLDSTLSERPGLPTMSQIAPCSLLSIRFLYFSLLHLFLTLCIYLLCSFCENASSVGLGTFYFVLSTYF
jgi:hypothetical protein